MPSIELNASERPFITLVESNVATLMTRYAEMLERAEMVKREAQELRNGAYAAIIQRARDEGALKDVKSLPGLPRVVKEKNEPIALVWADGDAPIERKAESQVSA